MADSLANYPGFPDFPDPFPSNFPTQPTFQDFSAFFVVGGMVFMFFFVCMIIAKFSSMKTSDRLTSREAVNTPKVHSYIAELKGKLKPIELQVEKYTKQPRKTQIKRFFELHEVAVPTILSLEERRKCKRDNILKLCGLMAGWGAVSYFLGIYVSVCSYLLFLYIFSRWRVPVIDPIEKCTETTIIPFNHQFQPLDLNDLLYGWLNFQKRSFTGLFKQMPMPSALHYSQYVKSTFVEIEADAEFFTIDHYQKQLPFSQAEGQSFFADPFPVTMPREFGDSFQEFPCQRTLEKKTCDTCGGKGTVRCSHCGGDGKVTCPWCGGRGYRESTHWVHETDHDGHTTSHTETERESCSCFGGHVTCSSCSGSGHVTCSTCRGEGSVGIFVIRKYEFHHLSKVKTYKETEDQVADGIDLTDIPNEDGRLIALDKGERYLGDNPDQVPSIAEATKQALKSTKQEFEQEINRLPNLIFDQYAYREFPELSVQFTYQEKNYALKGRGFKPLQKKYFQAEKFPVSWPRVCLFGLPPLLWIIFSFFI